MKNYIVVIQNKEHLTHVLQMQGFNITDIERQVYTYNKGFEIVSLTLVI
jgi:hypothetical protein